MKQRHMFGLEKLIISTNLPSNTQRETYLGLGRILTLGGTVVTLFRQRQLLEGSSAGSHVGASSFFTAAPVSVLPSVC